jgi:lipopolysaccharide export system ATP-binding protein
MTVWQNIAAVLEMFEDAPRERSRKLDNLLHEFHIEHVRNTSAIALSGGKCRRCEIARAVAANPAILLLDEPFAGIDPWSIIDITAMVKDLRKRGIGVLITDATISQNSDVGRHAGQRIRPSPLGRRRE